MFCAQVSECCKSYEPVYVANNDVIKTRCTCTQFDDEDPSIKHPIERQIFKHHVSHGPIQPSDGFIRNDEGRSFRAEWFNRFPWLEYSLLTQSAFCFYCRHFANEGSSTGRGGNVEAAFTSNNKLIIGDN